MGIHPTAEVFQSGANAAAFQGVCESVSLISSHCFCVEAGEDCLSSLVLLKESLLNVGLA